MKRQYNSTLLVLAALFTLGCQDQPKNCPNASVGKIRYRVAGHYCKQPTDSDTDAQREASRDLLKQTHAACKAGGAKDCEGAKCQEGRVCTIQPTKFGPEADPAALTTVSVPQDPLCGNGPGAYAFPTQKTDATGDWFFDCECNCTPKPQ